MYAIIVIVFLIIYIVAQDTIPRCKFCKHHATRRGDRLFCHKCHDSHLVPWEERQ